MSSRAGSILSSHITRCGTKACVTRAFSKYTPAPLFTVPVRPFSSDEPGFVSRVLNFFKQEAKNLNEVAQVIEPTKRTPKRRLLDKSVKPYCPPELLKPEETEKKEGEEDEEVVEEYTGPTDVTVTADGRTVWGKRLESAKEGLRSSAVYRKINRTKLEIEASNDPRIQRLVDMKYDVQDKLEDIKDAYEFSNNRVISTVRTVEDALTAETDQAFAHGELLRVDPDFNQMHLLEDLQEYMIPVVVSAFFRGDLDVMRSVMGDMALDATQAAIKERIAKKQFWDDTVIDISHVEIQQFTIENFVPMISVSFICQQIHCIRDHEDKIVEGSPSEIRSVFYMWTIKRDTYNPDFDWKIVDFKYQPMLALA